MRPELVGDGVASVHMRAEGFRDAALVRPTGRLGVGITKDNTLVLAGTRKPVTLMQWARALKALGAVDAMNLDAGESMGLYIDGRTLYAPARPLTNLLLVYDNRPHANYAHREASRTMASTPAMMLSDMARNEKGMPVLNQAAPAPDKPANNTMPSPVNTGNSVCR